jgi:hypothetical protein
MSNTIFPVETSTITVTPEMVDLFEDTFVSGAVASDMSVKIPMPVASLLTLLSPDFMDQMAIYCITPEIVGYIGIHVAFCAGSVSAADYFTYLAKNWEIPIVETALVSWLKSCMTQMDVYACFKQLREAFVLKHADVVCGSGATALMLACKFENSALAHKLLKTGRSLPNHISTYGSTSLMYACEAKLYNISLILLSCMNTDAIGRVNKFGMTALMYACQSCLTDVALAILETGMGKSEHVSNVGTTALTIACGKYMPEVALALLATGKGNPEHINGEFTALSIATAFELTIVVAELRRLGITK